MVQALEALSQVLRPPYQLVQAGVDNQWIFPGEHFPSEVESKAEPPGKIGDGAEVIPIDEVMGRYDYKRREITIFVKGVDRAAEILKARAVDLTLIVRCHEWSHALLHLGLKDADRLRITSDKPGWAACLEKATYWFGSLERPLHERLAQLLTEYSLQSLAKDALLQEAQSAVARIKTTFETLMQRQPSDYQIHKLAAVPKQRVITSIDLLKNGVLTGMQAWETVLTW
jgi:hypothetical protein